MDFAFDLAQAERGWKVNVHHKYGSAYSTAVDEYGKVAGAQAAADKASADAFATVISILSCSVGIGILAQLSMTRIVLRAGLQTLGRTNTRRVVDIVAAGRNNAVVSFTFGRTYDTLKDAASNRYKEIAGELVQRNLQTLQQILPLNRFIQLEDAVIQQAMNLGQMYSAVASDRALGAQREVHMTALRTSPFMNPPRQPVDEALLAKRIELAFYMMLILSGDHFVWDVEVMRPEPHMSSRRGADIDIMPSDPRYPTEGVITQHSPLSYRHTEVDRPGRHFRDRIDLLHNTLFRTPFYNEGWFDRRWGFDSNAGTHAHLVKAETLLHRLSAQSRPPNAMIAVP